ncbi:MAG: hypothetical protein Q8K19_15720, partial [Methylicorpusculum sp.]|uniref:hypothetical protein n=1 Tax=Methylicorpusculum sp. TaxID=2713644 RepID=UPI0027309BF4
RLPAITGVNKLVGMVLLGLNKTKSAIGYRHTAIPSMLFSASFWAGKSLSRNAENLVGSIPVADILEKLPQSFFP